jgi:hypothetical protein
MSLRSLILLLDIEAEFVSLQKDVRTDDANLLHFGDALKNFSDTAALISNLDLMISVDTSVAHLAGAVAKPVWVLLPFIPDWRWHARSRRHSWYPTARLFRQSVKQCHSVRSCCAVRFRSIQFVNFTSKRSAPFAHPGRFCCAGCDARRWLRQLSAAI